jgi:hypothetical protein
MPWLDSIDSLRHMAVFLYVWWIYQYDLYTCSGTNLLACVLSDAVFRKLLCNGYRLQNPIFFWSTSPSPFHFCTSTITEHLHHKIKILSVSPWSHIIIRFFFFDPCQIWDQIWKCQNILLSPTDTHIYGRATSIQILVYLVQLYSCTRVRLLVLMTGLGFRLRFSSCCRGYENYTTGIWVRTKPSGAFGGTFSPSWVVRLFNFFSSSGFRQC